MRTTYFEAAETPRFHLTTQYQNKYCVPNLNQVNLIGNITRDIETRYTPSGTAIAEVSLAINRLWKNDRGEKQAETTFV